MVNFRTGKFLNGICAETFERIEAELVVISLYEFRQQIAVSLVYLSSVKLSNLNETWQ